MAENDPVFTTRPDRSIGSSFPTNVHRHALALCADTKKNSRVFVGVDTDLRGTKEFADMTHRLRKSDLIVEIADVSGPPTVNSLRDLSSFSNSYDLYISYGGGSVTDTVKGCIAMGLLPEGTDIHQVPLICNLITQYSH